MRRRKLQGLVVLLVLSVGCASARQRGVVNMTEVQSTGEVERASWIVVSYLIAATIAAPIYGRLGDAFGRRRMMYVALAVTIVASLLCAAAPTVELLTAARGIYERAGFALVDSTPHNSFARDLVAETWRLDLRSKRQSHTASDR